MYHHFDRSAVGAINGKISSREMKETIFLRFKVCNKFISDNGSEFENEEVNKLRNTN